ncbi:ABC transporter substrate-binding protein, partial [Escherichia coli]|nr:ABC transporter substrate-binding protein [Escherichia coli]
ISELRWSNGKRPKTLDPVFAAAPPETDLARALFDGLTEIDPLTLQTIPSIAEKWEHSNDWRTWRFYIREDALWTNGQPVTASD